MKFALSNSAIVDCDFRSLVRRSSELGFNGVELSNQLASSLGPSDVRSILADASQHLACVCSSARFRGNALADNEAAAQVRDCLELAGHLGCHTVKLGDAEPNHRESVMTTISRLANWLAPLADLAGDRGMTILIENGVTLSTARPLWFLAEQLNHSAVGICWNIQRSHSAGENPAVTVPTLNHRIRCVKTTQPDIREPLLRLKGIGYTGWIVFAGGASDAETFINPLRSGRSP
ncbi:MAG TPA: TIM barrel protein [Tepidisphaeraceae bacterium]|nr:TIM barrel protein [Tepidisphaeraceae bacterium]